MDSFLNYDNLVSYQQQEEEGEEGTKDQILNQLAMKKREIQGITEGLTSPLIVDGARGLLRAGLKKGSSKLGEGGQKAVNKLLQMEKDYKEGGMKQVIENQKGALKSTLQEQVSKLRSGAEQKANSLEGDVRERLNFKKLTGEDEDPFSSPRKLFQERVKVGKVQPEPRQAGEGRATLRQTATENLNEDEDLGRATAKINNPFKLGGDFDEDILKGLGSNPTADDLRGAVIRQDLRSFGKTGKGFLKLGEDDMTSAQRQGVKIKLPTGKNINEDRLTKLNLKKQELKERYKGLSKEDRKSFKAELKEAREQRKSNPFTLENDEAGKGLVSDLDKREADVRLQEQTMNKYSTNPQSDDTVPSSTGKQTDLEDPTKTEPQTKGDDDVGQQQIEEDKPDIKAKLSDDAGGVGEDEETTGKVITKALTRAGEIDAEGGGVEDPVSDVISLVVGIGSLIGGLFGAEHKKANLPKLPPPPQAVLQVGV